MNESGESGLEGAQVVVLGTSLGTLAGAGGQFTISGVPAGIHRVQASYIGYTSRIEAVQLRAGESAQVVFELDPEAISLEGVVAVGYGTQRRQDVTGSIASVDAEDVPSTATATSAAQLIQGRVAGAHVVKDDGAPGGGISVRIRGTNSITANTQPLYVVDGVPGSSAVNPQDIESIEVLKDASATAIYGSRGSAGVVLITTKRGQRGENRMTVESLVGMQEPARRIPLLNGRQFAELANEARVNAGLPPVYTQSEVQSTGEGTNWQDAILRSAPLQSHTVTFSGGDDRTRYYLSGNFLGENGIVRGTQLTRYSARLNLDRTLTERLQVGAGLSLVNSDVDVTPGTAVYDALSFNPVSPVRDPATGEYVMNSPVTQPTPNPIALTNEILDQNSTFRVLGNTFAEFSVTPDLRLRSSLGLTTRFTRDRFYAPRNTPQGLGTNGIGRQSSVSDYDLISENILNYTRALRNVDRLDLTGGFTVQSSRAETLTGTNEEFVNDATSVYSLGAGTVPGVSSGYTESALVSGLARANYNLSDRYLFTATGRVDGSSRFGRNSLWGFFPSGAFAWRILEEPFLREQRLFSDLKLRLSYGETGNESIGLYQSIARLQTVNYGFGGARVIGFSPRDEAPNPDLKWETTRQFNAGLDFGLFDNRLTGSIDGYHSLTEDLLLQVDMPVTSGYRTQVRNVGSVQNRGVELALSSLNVDRTNFSWNSVFTVAANRNEVLDLGVADEIAGPSENISFQVGHNAVLIRVGEPAGIFMGYEIDGLYQEGDTCSLTLLRPNIDCVPGEYRYVDRNGDGQISSDDLAVLGHGHPDFYGGLTNAFQFGRFNLSVFLQGSYGGEVLNQGSLSRRQVNTTSNQTTHALDRWTPSNTNTTVPRANSVRSREIHEVTVEDGSYLRLQDVNLSYQLPANLFPAVAMARLFVNGQNLHVWTKYSGYDPEVNSFGGNSISRGIDFGAYPRARSVNVGIEARF